MSETLELSGARAMQLPPQSPTDEELLAARDRLHTEHGMWFPGSPKLASPSPQEFRATFAAHVRPDAEIVSIPGLLSALAVPDRPINGYLLLDIHDTVADLGGSLQRLQYPTAVPMHKRTNAHDYGNSHPTRKMFFSDDDRELKAFLYAFLHGLEDGLQPVEGLPEIVHDVSKARADGIYAGFITSVTKGSELPILRYFMRRYFRNICDFVVIPVVPEGEDYKSADKGEAATRIIKWFGHHPGMPVVAIDDLPGNTAKFRHALESLEPALAVQTIQPKLPSDRVPDAGSYQAENSLAAVRVARNFIVKHLGNVAL